MGMVETGLRGSRVNCTLLLGFLGVNLKMNDFELAEAWWVRNMGYRPSFVLWVSPATARQWARAEREARTVLAAQAARN